MRYCPASVLNYYTLRLHRFTKINRYIAQEVGYDYVDTIGNA